MVLNHLQRSRRAVVLDDAFLCLLKADRFVCYNQNMDEVPIESDNALFVFGIRILLNIKKLNFPFKGLMARPGQIITVDGCRDIKVYQFTKKEEGIATLKCIQSLEKKHSGTINAITRWGRWICTAGDCTHICIFL